MKQHFKIEIDRLELDDQHLAYRLYRNSYQRNGRRLLLLHGAGVAGADTWGHMIPYLDCWSEVLVPDLRGMGETRYPDGVEHSYQVEEVLADILGLLSHLQWWALDLGGYSFGGLISMLLKAHAPQRIGKQFLLESALLDRESIDQVRRLRQRYSSITALLRDGDRQRDGVIAFLDTIAPNRIASPRSEALTIGRLASRAPGFAHALDAVTDASIRLDRQRLLGSQGCVSSFIGGRSVDNMHLFHQRLAQQRSDWCYHRVSGCDHSLPFQKPRQIARQINLDMHEFLANLQPSSDDLPANC